MGTAPGAATAGQLVLNGGILGTTATMTLDSHRGITTGGTLDVATATTLTYGGIADGTGTLTKTGTGTLTLTGENTYTGNTTVSAGILVVNGDQHLATGALAVSGTLAGTGKIGGATTINSGGIHSPGDRNPSTGVSMVSDTQHFSGTLTYAAGSIFEWNLSENSTSTGFDMVGAVGAISVDTNSTVFKIVFGENVQMSDAYWSTPWITHTWAMSSIFGKAIIGAFQSVQTSSPLNSLGSFTISGDSLTYSTVPEPTTALAGLLLGAGLLRRRRWDVVR